MRAFVIAGTAVLGVAACSHAPKATRYIVDNQSAGWVKITYNRPDAPELPVEDGAMVVRISKYRHIDTRSRMTPSWDAAEFYYQGPDGKLVPLSSKDGDQRRLWGMEKTSDADGDRETFFVGKEKDFTHMSSAAGDIAPSASSRDLADTAIDPDHPDERVKVRAPLQK